MVMTSSAGWADPAMRSIVLISSVCGAPVASMKVFSLKPAVWNHQRITTK